MEDWVVLSMFLTISVGTGIAWLGHVIERWHIRSCLTTVVCEVVKNAQPLCQAISTHWRAPPNAQRNEPPAAGQNPPHNDVGR